MTASIQVATSAVVIGAGATAIMDLWALSARRLFNFAPANYCWVGRWFCHMPAGRFVHPGIAKAHQKPGECFVGWLTHYLIGIVYALALVFLTPGDWLQHPSLPPALAVGLGTLIFPFFVMQPAFGLGVASARAPDPVQARLKSVMAHLAFGIGLYVTALPIHHWVTAHS